MPKQRVPTDIAARRQAEAARRHAEEGRRQAAEEERAQVEEERWARAAVRDTLSKADLLEPCACPPLCYQCVDLVFKLSYGNMPYPR